MLNFNVLAGLDGIQQPLPVLQPCAGDRSVIGPCQQQNAVDVTRQPDQLIAILIAQRMPENGFQFSGVTGQVDVGETLEVFRHFGLPLRIEEAAPAAGHQELGERQLSDSGLRAVDRRLGRNIRGHQGVGLGQQIT